MGVIPYNSKINILAVIKWMRLICVCVCECVFTCVYTFFLITLRLFQLHSPYISIRVGVPIDTSVDSVNSAHINQTHIPPAYPLHKHHKLSTRKALPYPVTHREKVHRRGVTREIVTQINISGGDCKDTPLETQNTHSRLVLCRDFT